MEKANLLAFNGPGSSLEMLTVDIPPLKKDELLIKNLYTTICGSDLHTYCGLRAEKTPTVLGHEIVGEIAQFAEGHRRYDYLGNPLKIGDLVTWSIFSSDPNSLLATRGMPQKSDNLFKYGHAQITSDDSLHGGLATHCIIKAGTTVIKLSKAIPLNVAATINCSIATVAGAIRLSGNVRNKRIFITGSGLLGIVCAAMCHSNGAEAIYMGDINADRLKRSVDFGVKETLLLTKGQALPKNIDVVFDMSGSPDAMEQGLETLAVGGMAVWIGAVFKSRPVHVDAEKIVRGIISIKGLHNYNHDDLVAAVDFITEHHDAYPFEQIVEKEFSLEDAESALAYAVAQKPIRVGINITNLKSNGQ
ncbi:alcohol dehydrogenase catalytic domain-containing protein [Pedobacter sp. Leaf132]|uniref:zinc-binding dehydrogenase n=1 Tax=Pedobacter sp. Leaf132 TaxID=2876557 RepID=UPI001E4CCB71|nr:alcohol dehydrogenase catalytic domain-containing protein [Pedobacter sp. Leaf132]